MPRTRRNDEVIRWTPAGEYRHPATVYLPSTGVGSLGSRGEVTPSSTTSFDLRLRIESLAGDEAAYVRTQFPTATHRVTCRYDSRINERGRFVVGSSTLHILGVLNPNLENRELVMNCGEER